MEIEEMEKRGKRKEKGKEKEKEKEKEKKGDKSGKIQKVGGAGEGIRKEPKKKARFFDIDQKFPPNIKSWQEKSRLVFKLLRNNKVELEEEGEEMEEEKGSRSQKGKKRDQRQSKEEEEERRKRRERERKEKEESLIGDDAHLIRQIRRAAHSDNFSYSSLFDEKEPSAKEKEEELKKLDHFWESYFKMRVSDMKKFERALRDEREGEEGGLLTDIVSNVEAVLNETNLSQEHKDLLKNSFVAFDDALFEDVDELRSTSNYSRIYSLVGNAALDLVFNYHHRARAYSVEFHVAAAFKVAAPASDPGSTNIFSKYSFHRVPK